MGGGFKEHAETGELAQLPPPPGKMSLVYNLSNRTLTVTI